jgi:Ca2+-binding EF-hand superfamily protein
LALAGAVSYQGYKYWGEAQEKLRISGDRQKMSALFDKIDKDKSGMINGGELKVALKDAGVDVNFVNLKAMMMYADKDGNGEVRAGGA